MTGSDKETLKWLPVLFQVASIVAPLSIITSLLYYFGYVRRTTFCAYFGLDETTAAFNTTEYVIPSIGVTFRPLVRLIAVAVLAVLAHHALTILMRRSATWRKGIVAALLTISVGFLGFGISGLREHSLGPPILAPLALGSGAVLLEYSISTAQAGNMPSAWSLFQPALGSTSVARRVSLVLIALGALFWATANLAYESGLSEAIRTERALGADLQVVVYSKQRLDLLGDGIASVTLPPSDTAAYRYRYSGLRLLRHTKEQWLLLPAGWRRGNRQPVIILPDHIADIRVELRN